MMVVFQFVVLNFMHLSEKSRLSFRMVYRCFCCFDIIGTDGGFKIEIKNTDHSV